jgi:hypothetical protein
VLAISPRAFGAVVGFAVGELSLVDAALDAVGATGSAQQFALASTIALANKIALRIVARVLRATSHHRSLAETPDHLCFLRLSELDWLWSVESEANPWATS